ncbi:hypothetical protein FRB95_006433 [Tulasnella sp. JGI-2019a]|nr:hypothetical protein FRB95_006433 [Tulasnella sp. JGI-2019a]
MLDPAWARAVAQRLRPSKYERIKAVMLAEATPVEPSDSRGTQLVLAIVANEEGGMEEAGLLIFELGDAHVLHLRTTTVIPIDESFVIKVTQSSKVETSSEEVDQEESDTDIIVTAKGGDQRVSCIVIDTETLQSFLTQARQLTPAADPNRDLRSYSWLKWYNPKLLHRAHVLDARTCHHYLRSPFKDKQLSIATPGVPGDEGSDCRIIRDDWIRTHMRSRIDEFAKRKPLTVRIGTFNVNGRDPTGSLSAFVQRESEVLEPATLPDLFVFGFQELDLSSQALIYQATTRKETVWFDAIMEGLGPSSADYVKLTSKQLVGMLIIAILRRPLRPHIGDISSTSSGQGVMWLGNKGGVAIQFRIYDTMLTFVNSHLAAFDDQIERRNSDYSELRRALSFHTPAVVPKASDESMPMTHYSDIFNSDYVFWLGDLNYRIELPDHDVRVLLVEAAQGGADFSRLLSFDQLTDQRRLGRAFAEFIEGPITFPPTYRCEINSVAETAYDTKRRPAWTDRIFYRNAGWLSFKQTAYAPHPSIRMSDHKPVTSDFQLEVFSLDPERMSDVLDDVAKSVMSITDLVVEACPILSIERADIDLGAVSFGMTTTQTCDLTNPGTTACAFRILDGSSDELLLPSWLTVIPMSGLILPGESRIISIVADVDRDTAAVLNKENGELRSMLTIHVEHGGDHIVSVSGAYNRTCFGNSLSWLGNLPDAIRKVDTSAISEKESPRAPRELIWLVSWLMTNGIKEENLFLLPGDEKQVQIIRDCLDTGEEFPPADGGKMVLSVGQTLIDFLDSLTEPVIPWSFHDFASSVKDREEAYGILESLPTASANVWISLTAFLHFKLQDGSGSSKAKALAEVFAPVLLRDDPSLPPSRWMSPLAKRTFVMYFLG